MGGEKITPATMAAVGAAKTVAFGAGKIAAVGAAVLVFVLLLSFGSCARYKPAVDLSQADLGSIENGVTCRAGFDTESGLNYLVTVPEEKSAAREGTFPTIVFLHSLEERGDSLAQLVRNTEGQGLGLAGFAVEEPGFPFLTVSPLCPARTYWFSNHDRLATLIKQLCSRYPIDRRRVYLMGVSMGGMGTWSMAMAYPELFAAAAPVAGGVYSPPMRREYAALRTVPFYVFHARHDPSIPFKKADDALEGLRDAGGNGRIKVYDTETHYIHGRVFREGELFSWFLTHQSSSQ